MATLDSLFAARESVRFAAGALMAHKLRSTLTIIGIVIGVTTVISMVSIIEGFNNNVTHDCHDDSAGSGTAGTANTWTNDEGSTENRAGLCNSAVVTP